MYFINNDVTSGMTQFIKFYVCKNIHERAPIFLQFNYLYFTIKKLEIIGHKGIQIYLNIQ